MPEYTVTLTDEEAEHLEQLAAAQGIKASRMVWQIVKRQLSKTNRQPHHQGNATRDERMKRQLFLVRHIERLPEGVTLDREEKRVLAQKFGVTERTIYRDVELAAQIVAESRQAPSEALTG